MASEDNAVHGPSVLRVIPTTDDHRAALSDTSAEVVYVADEEYADGYVCRRICWRPSYLAGSPKSEQKTYLTPIVWFHVKDNQ